MLLLQLRLRGGGKTGLGNGIDALDGWIDTWLDKVVMNVGRGARARERSLEAANEMQAQAKTRAQREEAEYQVKRAKHLIQWCEAASNIRPQKFKRIDAAVKARDELPGELDPGYDSEAYNAAEKHAEDVMTREIGMPGPFMDHNPRELSPWADSVLNANNSEDW